jgi:Tol biopolymer transport system component
MKKSITIFLIFLGFGFLYSALATIFSTPITEAASIPAVIPAEPYIGQTLPGAEPRAFADFLINGELRSAPVFTPDGSEVYWSVFDEQGSHINSMKLTNGTWSSVKKLELASGITDCGNPYISPDGARLFFTSSSGSTGEDRLWVADRFGDTWIRPRPLPEVINDLHIHWSFYSTTLAGDLYFSAGEDGFNDLYVSRLVNGEYTAPMELGAPVNTPDAFELTPAVAPDGSYLVFARLPGYQRPSRLYISYRLLEGVWSTPRLIYNIEYGLAPAFTSDSRYLFYLGRNDTVSWRDTSFIVDLRKNDNSDGNLNMVK